jgi:hypothetical protein
MGEKDVAVPFKAVQTTTKGFAHAETTRMTARGWQGEQADTLLNFHARTKPESWDR